jgi:hypothetical protein
MFIGKTTIFRKSAKKKINLNSPFNDYYEILLVSRDSESESLIKLNFSSNTNQTTKVIIDDKVINFADKNYIKILNYIMKKNLIYFLSMKKTFIICIKIILAKYAKIKKIILITIFMKKQSY